MTQEDKDLLLGDLCARLPYGVVLKVYHSAKNYINDCGETEDEYLGNLIQSIFIEGFIWFRPYLRPMSSMTEEEKNEYLNTFKKSIIGTDEEDGRVWTVDSIDWLNAHHFDYRGLIERGLAIEAPEDMYW